MNYRFWGIKMDKVELIIPDSILMDLFSSVSKYVGKDNIENIIELMKRMIIISIPQIEKKLKTNPYYLSLETQIIYQKLKIHIASELMTGKTMDNLDINKVFFDEF